MKTVGPSPERPIDPALWAKERFGLDLDPWQSRVLYTPSARVMRTCGRRVGKTTVFALAAIHEAVSQPQSVSLLVSPAGSQARTLLDIIRSLLDRAGIEVGAIGYRSIWLRNGSTIFSEGVGGGAFCGLSAPNFVGFDEPAYCSDEAYEVVRRMENRRGAAARLMLMGTPRARDGFFFRAWFDGAEQWDRESVSAHNCPRIAPDSDWMSASPRGIPGEGARLAREVMGEFVD